MNRQVSNKRYWEKRALQREKLMQSRSTKAVQRIIHAYDKAAENIDKEMHKIFYKFATDSRISSEKARELLNNTETDEVIRHLREKIQSVTDEDARRKLLNRINAPAYAARLTRLEALKENVYMELKKVAGEEISIDRNLFMDTYEDSYYRTIFDIQQGVRFGVNFAILPKQAITEVLNHKFFGKNFSSRVWKNTEEVAKRAQEVIEGGILSGAPIEKMADELKDLSDLGKFAATRLVRTETAYFMGQGELASYTECGITEYRYLATLDSRTSRICARLDGMIYNVSEACPGVNYPPMHPYCRSTTVAHLEDDKIGQRIARDPVTGKNYYVDGNMTYQQWKRRIQKSLNGKIDGSIIKLPDGTYSTLTPDTQITDVEVFAGKGANKELRVKQHLENNYGGNADDWAHMKGRGFVDVDGQSRKAMLHWFEEPTVGVVEVKVKGWSKK